MSKNSLILLMCLSFSLTLSPVFGEPKQGETGSLQTSEIEKLSASEIENRHQQLLEAVTQVLNAIILKDPDSLAKWIDPDSGVYSKKRGIVYFDQFKEEMKNKNSHYSCHLFGCKKNKKMSVAMRLSKMKGHRTMVEVFFFYNYEWGGAKWTISRLRQPALIDATPDGLYRQPELAFRWKKGRWFIYSLFEK